MSDPPLLYKKAPATEQNFFISHISSSRLHDDFVFPLVYIILPNLTILPKYAKNL